MDRYQWMQTNSMHANPIKSSQIQYRVTRAVVDFVSWKGWRCTEDGVKRPPFWRRYFAGRNTEWLPVRWWGPTHQRRAQWPWPTELPQWWEWATHTPGKQTQHPQDECIADRPTENLKKKKKQSVYDGHHYSQHYLTVLSNQKSSRVVLAGFRNGLQWVWLQTDMQRELKCASRFVWNRPGSPSPEYNDEY